MKTQSKLLALFIGLAGISLLPSCNTLEDRDFYELRFYRFETDVQESRLDHYLEDAYLPALHRAGVTNVGVFKLREDGNEIENALLLLIPYRTLDKFVELSGDLQKDKLHQEAGRDYIDSPHNDPPYGRIESILLRAFAQTPHLSVPGLDSPRADRVYELRSYQGATELLYERKVEMFNSGESALFEKLDFNPVFFGEVISSSFMPHLMYMTTFADTIAQRERWDAFRIHPDWQEMKEIDRYKNTVSDITKYLLYPTPYSDY